MCSNDLEVQSQALYSLSEQLRNPLNCFRAINEFNIAKRLADTIDNFFPEILEKACNLERLLMIIGLVASHYIGAIKLLNEYQLISTLYDMIIDNQCISRHAATVLLRMSYQPHVSDLMAEGDHLRRVRHILSRVEDLEEVYDELANLIERSPAKALDEGCFKFLVSQIEYQTKFQSRIMKCFALLINCPDAQEQCDQIDLVKVLFSILSDDSLPIDTLEYTAMALKNSMFSTKAIWRCREFWDLPTILIKRAHCKENDRLQVFCLQTLRQITAMPSMKNFVRKTCKKRIKNIACRQKYVEQYKEKLLAWLRKKPYININPDLKTAEIEVILPEFKLPETGEEQEEKFEKPCGKTSTPRAISYRLDYHPVKTYEDDISSITSSTSSDNSDQPN